MQDSHDNIASPDEARTIFRRASKIMLVIAAVELAITIWNIVHQPDGNITVGISLLIGAAMLWSCNLRAVSLVRWFSAAYVPMAALGLYFVLRQPAELTFAYLRLYPVQVSMLLAVALAHWLLALWLLRELGRPPVLAARAAAGKKRRDTRIPFALGTAGVIAAIIFSVNILGSERATRATLAAQQKVGKNYKVYPEGINILSIRSTSGERSNVVNASVAAWNDNVIIHVPVSWREP